MMTMAQLELPVRKWVPDWLGVVSMFAVILPVTMLNGTYTGSMLEVSNTLGTYSEDITMGYYAASAGMAMAYPIIAKVMSVVSSKVMLLVDLTLQFLLSWLCARSQNADMLIVCSFFIGFLKGFLMMWGIHRMHKIFSPNNVRSEFYAYFYPLVYGGGQLSMIITAELASHHHWQDQYNFINSLLPVALLFVAICFRNDKPLQRIPLKVLHIREILVISTGILMVMYVLNYGKVLDWMASPRICLYIAVAPMLIAFFIWLQHHSRSPYVYLAPPRQPKAIVGYFYMMLVMFFSTSTTLLTNYMTSILQVDATRTYVLYIYLLPGYVLGAFICFWWFRWQRWRFRFLIAGGMSCFALFFGMLYFGISPDSTYEMLFLPIFIRGLGMLTLIIAFALFAVEDLQFKYFPSNAFFLILSRSVLAPVIATSFYSNLLYRLQQHYIHSLAENFTLVDPQAAERYDQALNSYLAQGHGYSEAAQMAVSSLNSILQQQALLLALKEILGWLFVVSLVIAVISRFIPFHKTIRVRYAKTGDDMV